jgi:excisionase family DNA binding protein
LGRGAVLGPARNLGDGAIAVYRGLDRHRKVDMLLSVERITPVTAYADLPSLLTPKEAAMWVGINKIYFYTYIASKQIPAQRAGRLLRIRKEDLQAWLERGNNPS